MDPELRRDIKMLVGLAWTIAGLLFSFTVVHPMMSRQYAVTVGTVPASGFPTQATTGVPAGTTLTDLALNNPPDNDAYIVTTADTVLDAVHIPGHLLIRAQNVTIKNSWIEGNVFNDWSGSYMAYTIRDSTLTHSPDAPTDPNTGEQCNVSPALLWSNYTALRVEITGHDDGFRYTEGGPVDIRDSYARMCWLDETVTPPDGSHSGGIQAQCASPCGSLTMVHNNIDNNQRCLGPSPCAGVAVGDLISNSGISVQSFSGNVVTGPVTLTNNLVSGGGYTLILWWFSGGSNYQVTDNRIVDGDYDFGPVDTQSSCENQTWSGNTRVTLVDEVNYQIASTVAAQNCVD